MTAGFLGKPIRRRGNGTLGGPAKGHEGSRFPLVDGTSLLDGGRRISRGGGESSPFMLCYPWVEDRRGTAVVEACPLEPGKKRYKTKVTRWTVWEPLWSISAPCPPDEQGDWWYEYSGCSKFIGLGVDPT